MIERKEREKGNPYLPPPSFPAKQTAIVLGVVGGLLVAALLAVVAWLMCRARCVCYMDRHVLFLLTFVTYMDRNVLFLLTFVTYMDTHVLFLLTFVT